MTSPLNNLTDTWNNSGTVFTGLKYNITNTASAAGSKVFDFQIGGNSVFDFDITTGILSQRNSANAQTFHVYNKYTDSSNYERGVLDWITTSNVLTIGAQNSGTGTARYVRFLASASNGFFFSVAGNDKTQIGNGFIATDQILLDYSSADLVLARGAAGILKFASSQSFSANGSVATSITSVGPTGANTTVQEWLTIKNASGTTRYIPCF